MSAGGGILSSFIQYGAQKKAQKRSAEIARNAALNQYVWGRMSLEKAGYNPILAVSQPPPMTHVPQAGYPSAKMGDLMEGARTGARISDELGLLKATREGQEFAAGRAEQDMIASGFNRIKAREEAVIKGVERRKAQATLPSALAQEKLDRTKWGERMRWLNRTIKSVTGRAERP